MGLALATKTLERMVPVTRTSFVDGDADAGGEAGLGGELRGVFAGDEEAAFGDEVLEVGEAVVAQAGSGVGGGVEQAHVWV